MKVIFLDIDGVLNSLRSCIGLGGYSNPGCFSRGESPRFDPVAVGLLRRLVERTGAQIVVSSTWRASCLENDNLKRALATWYGWENAPIIGRTKLGGGRRGPQIQEWLDAHQVENYVILDDDADMLEEQMPYLVQTHFNMGLSYEHIKQAATILGMPENVVLVP